MTASAVLELARSAGVRLERRPGDKLGVVAPNGLPPGMRDALAEHKAEVLSLISAGQTPQSQPPYAGVRGLRVFNPSPDPWPVLSDRPTWDELSRLRWGGTHPDEPGLDVGSDRPLRPLS